MAEVVLFHHVQGLTDGVLAFAVDLRAGGHTVHTPDLFDGQRPATIEDGLTLTERIGDDVLGERADRAVADLPEEPRLRRLLLRRPQRSAPCPDPARCAGRTALRVLHPDHRRVGLRAVASRGPGADPRHGQGPLLRAGGRH